MITQREIQRVSELRNVIASAKNEQDKLRNSILERSGNSPIEPGPLDIIVTSKQSAQFSKTNLKKALPPKIFEQVIDSVQPTKYRTLEIVDRGARKGRRKKNRRRK